MSSLNRFIPNGSESRDFLKSYHKSIDIVNPRVWKDVLTVRYNTSMGKNVLALFILLLSSTDSSQVSLRLIPESIFPGDAFFIEVRSEDTPSGIFDGRRIDFYRASENIYYGVSFVRLDMEPGEYHVSISTGGHSLRQKIRVDKKIFPIQRISLPPEKVFLSPEDEERVRNENIRVAEILSRVTKRLWDGMFTPPLDTSISMPFGVVRIINEKKRSVHTGVDYRVGEGEPVRAINSGEVVLKDELFFGGKTIILNHGGGIYSLYMHLSQFLAEEGKMVERGDVIGLAGSTGRATGPHLHLHLKMYGMDVNPESIFILPLFRY